MASAPCSTLSAQMAIGPRPSGSAAGRKTGDYIVAQLREQGWQVEEQEFVYRGVRGRNIVGKAGIGPSGADRSAL